MVLARAEAAPVIGIDAAHEGVRIEARRRGHHQEIAVVDVHDEVGAVLFRQAHAFLVGERGVLLGAQDEAHRKGYTRDDAFCAAQALVALLDQATKWGFYAWLTGLAFPNRSPIR